MNDEPLVGVQVAIVNLEGWRVVLLMGEDENIEWISESYDTEQEAHDDAHRMSRDLRRIGAQFVHRYRHHR
jgi:hypothetical protein